MLACIITLALWFTPYGIVNIYPLRILITYALEAMHALAAILTLGSVVGMRVFFLLAAGKPTSRGSINPVIYSTGYLGTTLFGAALQHAE
ncbi:MAG: M50 family metallopeptidase [Acidobacteriota bacterium]|nr:M50 family metallopeptidase [Blastocatellia bacterium]MDW8413801.1 M50 family metallopeptidase [Acidobacteriota bacterium]